MATRQRTLLVAYGVGANTQGRRIRGALPPRVSRAAAGLWDLPVAAATRLELPVAAAVNTSKTRCRYGRAGDAGDGTRCRRVWFPCQASRRVSLALLSRPSYRHSVAAPSLRCPSSTCCPGGPRQRVQTGTAPLSSPAAPLPEATTRTLGDETQLAHIIVPFTQQSPDRPDRRVRPTGKRESIGPNAQHPAVVAILPAHCACVLCALLAVAQAGWVTRPQAWAGARQGWDRCQGWVWLGSASSSSGADDQAGRQ